MNEQVKKLCYMKGKIYENVKNGRTDADKDKLVRITSLSSDTIPKAKEKYLHSLGNQLLNHIGLSLTNFFKILKFL